MAHFRSMAQRLAAAPSWVLALVGGALLWGASTVALAWTDDDILLPTVVLTGSFFVPVAVVFWFVEHDRDTALGPRRLLLAFFIAGVLGLLAAAVLEIWLLPHRLLPNLWVGLIEEAVKGIGVIVCAAGLLRHTVRDGVLLGVAVGLGFGAFESAGYTLSWGVDAGGFSLSRMLSEEVLRASIAPFCHGLWTGIFGAALFAASRDGRLRFTRGVAAAYLLAAGLHALWDAGSAAAIVVTVLATGDELQREALASGSLPEPSTLSPQWLYGAVQWAVMIVVALAGSLLVRRRWHLTPTG